MSLKKQSKPDYNSDTFIIIPVYNEDKAIQKVVKELRKYFVNIICVNDGSTDNTLETLEQLPCTVINHPINLGQGAALQTGIEYAVVEGGSYFVTFDADGQHLVADALKFVGNIKKNKYDIILGSRFLKNAAQVPLPKKILLKSAIIFTNLTSKINLTDTHNGLRVFNRKVAKNLNITVSGYGHASEIIDTISKQGWKYKELPMTVMYTNYSQSDRGQPMINAVNIAFDMIVERMRSK